MSNATMYGYAGKILRVNLTDRSATTIDSSKYLPDYVGGHLLCNKIFWDEVGPGVGAFDPENKLIFANGPTTGCAIPTGGRAVMTGISPISYPEQYASSSIGGWVGTVMKYAGYDALIIEGKAEQPTYLFIDDDKTLFLDASHIWGMLISDAQEAIMMAHGPGTFAMSIGPAGEHLCRNAAITTSNDNTFSKAGFGAVFGAKNLKAVAFRGTGDVTPADIEKVFDLRTKIGRPDKSLNPVVSLNGEMQGYGKVIPVPPCTKSSRLACSPGCNSRCNGMFMDVKSPFTGELVSQVEKCVSPHAFDLKNDGPFSNFFFVSTEKNDRNMGMFFSYGPKPFDETDPYIDLISEVGPGDFINYHKPSFTRGELENALCKDYGLDKADFVTWYMPWVSACYQEGLLDDLDFGMVPDPDDPVFVKHFMDMIVYREGIGDIFAEGMARAVRILGKSKYGDSIYHNRYTNDDKKTPLDIPVSLELGWGQVTHWHGRGFNGCKKWFWIGNSLTSMVNTHDVQAGGHFRVKAEELVKIQEEGPCYSQTLIDRVIHTENARLLKDSLTSCEFQGPMLYWPTMEQEMYNAATGLDLSVEELFAKADRGRLMMRAILMRNHGRDRDAEVEEIYPFLTYPDPSGETVDWEEWNNVVNLYYAANGWDLQTGWPTRSTWEKYGLGDIADEMERLGKLPAEDSPFTLKESPFDGHVRKSSSNAERP